ncbi:FecR domain-containing protein [Pelagicoccus sp. SDUM812003]|uniref:FecR domain-containing protein n=1 Tax=Pelagicoccus sp. SDUM812003 TaxID=3041267 RepID=UPI00280ED160|nr:FecR domain-containing protein [Pelagicoccus sp. SDUM812003]MDQ8204288.1 TonB-dependent receptor [Pelagicoccus sp. SDUM812003]
MPSSIPSPLRNRLRSSCFVGSFAFCFRSAARLILGGLLGAGAVFADDEASGLLKAKRGKVDHMPYARGVWVPAPVGQSLFARDRLYTHENASATVWLSDRQPVDLGELSTLEILPKHRSSVALRLLKGALYFFNRESDREAEVRTPHATGAPRGTEFLVTVDEKRTRLVVFDGEAVLRNEKGEVTLSSGYVGIAEAGSAPVREPLRAESLVQWWIYYPGILDVSELEFSDRDRDRLADSLVRFATGDLPGAFESYPGYPNPEPPAGDATKVYLANLLLGAGQLDKAKSLLSDLSHSNGPAEGLRWLIAGTQRETKAEKGQSLSASELVGQSYYYQSRFEHANALQRARASTVLSPRFGYAWQRVAELEWASGNESKARQAFQNSLTYSPANAQAQAFAGFLAVAKGDPETALKSMEEAVQSNSTLSDAWLGRGLVRMRNEDISAAIADLQIAAALDLDRSLTRSYLGKAFSERSDFDLATLEFERAKSLDPDDPTPWLYSALAKKNAFRVNEAVRDLEHSIELNDNRAVFRSRLLLDRDQAVRRANLAEVYARAGLAAVATKEASRAVAIDYANFSAHQFLADSFNAQRDPNLVDLRYETATFSEYLLANLLSPVGGTPLSFQVSQQEYTRLFERDRTEMHSNTRYASDGQWQQSLVVSGRQGGFEYAVEANYRDTRGLAANTDLDQRSLSIQMKREVSNNDTAYAQAVFSKAEFGDLAQRFDPYQTSPNFRGEETQSPNLFLGWRHKWSPQSQTLFLASRVVDELVIRQPDARIDAFVLDGEGALEITLADAFAPYGEVADRFAVDFTSRFEAYGVEFQQIWDGERLDIVVGARAQSGDTWSKSEIAFLGDPFPGFYFPEEIPDQAVEEGFRRVDGYAYMYGQLSPCFQFVGGVGFSWIEFPSAIQSPPVSSGSRSEDAVYPKIGFMWTLSEASVFRGAYSRSLGGLFQESSVRLEPAQINGFGQAYRSLAPESVVGTVPGARFESISFGSDHNLAKQSYFGWEGERLSSEVTRMAGVFSGVDMFRSMKADAVSQDIEYEELNFSMYFNRLIGESWSLGGDYRIRDSKLSLVTPGLSETVWETGFAARSAKLQQIGLWGAYSHRSGIYGRLRSTFVEQKNAHDDQALGSEAFWQFDAFFGYRWPRQRMELSVGLLNLTDQDYRLNPLSPHGDYARSRTVFASFSFSL